MREYQWMGRWRRGGRGGGRGRSGSHEGCGILERS